MPMAWTPETNAKLFVGVLELLKNHNVKLDHDWLADYMGPGCTWKAIERQITKLRKQAAQDVPTGSASAPSTPMATPTKRRVGPLSKTATPTKKAKAVPKDETDVDADVDAEAGVDDEKISVLKQIKKEMKALGH
ncbi:hypothetical protein BDW59DRAFT_164483 [Aspergillus cavernicola]|uniref:Uncharacterized protein n=1 Tax=Aspergillus cavernicola TaxID=176166 RepID=A0ABR4HZM4_9EURO